MSISMIGLDTAKSVFQVHAADETGQMVIKRKLQRSEVIPFFKKLEGCTIVMEACGAAHHWARVLTGPTLSPLGWLAPFLAPMQDGTFQQGEITVDGGNIEASLR